MEDFGARAESPEAVCRQKIADCDIFIGILGHRYGSSPEGRDLSYSEWEYNQAVGEGKPTLMFLAPKDFRISADLIETDERSAKQRVFRQRIMGEKQIEYFRSHEHLATASIKAIYNLANTRGVDEEEAGSGSEVCTTLLFPFSTNLFGFDTGISVCNASAKPIGKCPKAGRCTIHFFGSSEERFAATQTSAVVEPGETLAFTLSAGNPAWLIGAAEGFQGYLVAECYFPDAHGFAFVTDGAASIPTLAAGYLAQIVSKDNP